MKKNSVPANQPHEKTHPILVEAKNLMLEYARATGARICVNDHNYMPIPEIFREISYEKNICLFCMKYKNHVDVKDAADCRQNPCWEKFINANDEAQKSGGSHSFVCDMGFTFWTSPVYANERFIGTLIGSGYLGTEKTETCDRMNRACGGMVSKEELMTRISCFPQGESWKIKALAELLLISAESLSAGNDRRHATVRRRARQQARLSAKVEELRTRYPADAKRPEYPMDKERKLLEALKRGDTESGREYLNEILAVLLVSNPLPPAAGWTSSSAQFKFFQCRAIELAVLLSRTDTGLGFTSESILEINNQYLASIQEARNIEELTDALYQIVDDIAGQIFSFQGIRHASALKKAEHYILENLDRKISLEEIAGVSGFSAPYFSTIFKEEMGENLSSYLNRLRVEKACYLLVNTNSSLSKIIRICGFKDQSWFSKIFKVYAGISPSKYRNKGGIKVS